MVRPIVWFFALSLVAACGARPDLQVTPDAMGKEVEVYFSTTRTQNADGVFHAKRSSTPTYGRISVAIPPKHEQGKVETRARNVNPQTDFVATGLTRFETSSDFRRSIAATLRARPSDKREVVIFVHGFNNTFGEGVYRMAQLAYDFEFPGIAVHYSWSSAANLLAYTHDRDSALFARDGLEDLLEELNKAGATQVVLVGHSMGSELTMEVLRQISIQNPRRLDKLVDGVILISPDTDVDLFRQQALRIGKLPQPFVVFTSRRDRALAISSRLNGVRNRLGNLTDVEKVADLDVTLLNITNYGEGLGHFTVGSSQALISLIGGVEALDDAFSTDAAGRNGLLPSTVLTVRNATEIVLGGTN